MATPDPDKQGRFDARRFQKTFGARSTVDRNGDKAFTATELTRMIGANRKTLAAISGNGRVAAVACAAADTKAVEGAVGCRP